MPRLSVAWSSTPEVRAQFGLTLSNLNGSTPSRRRPPPAVGEQHAVYQRHQRADRRRHRDRPRATADWATSPSDTTGRGDGTNARTGSHNLILGDLNNYSSYGGLVVGSFNAVTDAYCSVSGGVGNTASVFGSSVSGGVGNTASGAESTVSGGYRNTAVGFTSSVSGGSFRAAPGDYNWAAGELFEAN
ncbi:MAG: hypothetical protein U0790_18950 [Isosphaeraceae bacterium]